MTICGSNSCGCALQSSTLSVAGSGSGTDPWIIEQAEFSDIQELRDDVDDLQASYISKEEFDASGDLLVGTANDAFANVPVGDDGQVLTADSGAGAGVSWQGTAMELIASGPTTGSSFVLASSIPQTYRHLVIEGNISHNNAAGGSAFHGLGLRFNGNTGTNYRFAVSWRDGAGTTSAINSGASAVTRMLLGHICTLRGAFRILIPAYTTGTGTRMVTCEFTAASTLNPTVAGGWRQGRGVGIFNIAQPVTQIEVMLDAGGVNLLATGNHVSLYGLR